ncbi:sorbosone dehydrogenase family protein [Paraglaciecola sp. L3A3]|uniref:PQQ-dependent sugar dehydrogenase n=1 Tax=Paraglaciecola sp. L3A3 TaxID=2686358 RepID=UPI00131CF85D|nr:PQQ-dependent sugar dehydrogenase [Paraglaciecola sp. L3A3]
MKKLFACALLICCSRFSYGFELQSVLTEIEQPTDLLFLPDSKQELLIAEKNGGLLLANLEDQSHNTIYTFDVRTKSEMGLLGLTLHPDFKSNGYLFVNYNPKEGKRRTRISRFRLTLLEHKGSLDNEKVILEVEQPYGNHNAGQLAFGPDGYLYVGMGDGGSGGDPKGHGQNRQTLLGTMLRLDINTPDNVPYQIPSDNPFINDKGSLDEIWAYGIRNPWRFTFYGDSLILADVGQNELEEVNIIHKGKNYGWKIMEGNKCFKDKKQSCDKSQFEPPLLTYGRDDGQSITGGVVYSKGSVKSLVNRYVYADYISGKIWSVNYPSFGDNQLEVDTNIFISSFALDNTGELYFTDFATGKIMKVVN